MRPVEGEGEEAPGQNRTKQSFTSTVSSTDGYTVTLVGDLYHNPLPNGGKEVDIMVLHNLQPPEENEEADPDKPANKGSVAEIQIKLDGKNIAVKTTVEDFSSGKSVTSYHPDHGSHMAILPPFFIIFPPQRCRRSTARRRRTRSLLPLPARRLANRIHPCSLVYRRMGVGT